MLRVYPGEMARAILFDIDGTLVDSNYLHVEAWSHAFASMHVEVDAWRIHRGIGQDSQRLLSSLVGERDEDWLSTAKDAHSRFYRQLTERLRPFSEARELLRDVAERGVRVVLATSAPDDELKILLDVIDCEDAIYATTSAADVDNAKPDPGIIDVALQRAEVDAAHALMIGDATWDMEAAGRASVGAIGVRSGGVGGQELRDAGALDVYDDVEALRADLDAILARLS